MTASDADARTPAPETAASRRRPGDSAVHRRQRSKNLALLAVLLALCAVFYFTAIIRMSGG